MNDEPRPLPLLDSYNSDQERIERAIQRERSRRFLLEMWRQGQAHNQQVRAAVIRKEGGR